MSRGGGLVRQVNGLEAVIGEHHERRPIVHSRHEIPQDAVDVLIVGGNDLLQDLRFGSIRSVGHGIGPGKFPETMAHHIHTAEIDCEQVHGTPRE